MAIPIILPCDYSFFSIIGQQTIAHWPNQACCLFCKKGLLEHSHRLVTYYLRQLLWYNGRVELFTRDLWPSKPKYLVSFTEKVCQPLFYILVNTGIFWLLKSLQIWCIKISHCGLTCKYTKLNLIDY